MCRTTKLRCVLEGIAYKLTFVATHGTPPERAAFKDS